jgi:hypothetical protein
LAKGSDNRIGWGFVVAALATVVAFAWLGEWEIALAVGLAAAALLWLFMSSGGGGRR